METIVLIVHVVLAAAIIALVLLQQGKGAEAGASFGGGGGASQTVFGSSGSTSFLARVTGALAFGLFVTSFVLAVFAKEKANFVSDAGIPDAQVIEAQATSAEQELPELKALPSVQPETDIPSAN